jgi:hypothetical protein
MTLVSTVLSICVLLTYGVKGNQVLRDKPVVVVMSANITEGETTYIEGIVRIG